jgi:hypothetical protein
MKCDLLFCTKPAFDCFHHDVPGTGDSVAVCLCKVHWKKWSETVKKISKEDMETVKRIMGYA